MTLNMLLVYTKITVRMCTLKSQSAVGPTTQKTGSVEAAYTGLLAVKVLMIPHACKGRW